MKWSSGSIIKRKKASCPAMFLACYHCAKNEDRKEDPTYAGICTVYLLPEEQLETGSGVPRGERTQKWERWLPCVTLTISSRRLAHYLFKRNTRARLLSLSHWTVLHVEMKMKLVKYQMNLSSSGSSRGLLRVTPPPISSPCVGSNCSLNHKGDQLTLQTAQLSNRF